MNINENKLNRSRSESDINNISEFHYSPDIVRRTVVIEEIYGNYNSRRYLSCTRLFGDNSYGVSNINSFNQLSLDTTDTSLQMQSNTTYKNYSERNSSHYLDNSSGVVPMDVDSSFDWDERYPKLMGTNFESSFNRFKSIGDARYKASDNALKRRILIPTSTDTVTDETGQRREFVIDSECQTQKEPIIPIQKKGCSNKWIVLLLLIAVLTAFYITLNNGYGFISVNSALQIENVQKDLLENVFEQPSPIEVIVHTLEQRRNWQERVKVLGFIGSQGVGKTFTVNIIRKHFIPCLVHDILGAHLSYKSRQTKIFESINGCCLNLVVIDDLTREDNVELFAFIHSLPRDHFILVISIFNIQYTSNDLESEIRYEDIIEIRNAFDNSELYYELVLFREFSPEQVRNWVTKQLSLQNITTQMQNEVIESVLKGHDSAKLGLKGLHFKLLLELEKYKK
ncbi:uncharacterized protein [Leptinotarsa decemlineata]|uniref:uncharacterized protein n=1 Tax=Leptinotarsa decemlineata TaxID=7539 RepID=UPI003D305576